MRGAGGSRTVTCAAGVSRDHWRRALPLLLLLLLMTLIHLIYVADESRQHVMTRHDASTAEFVHTGKNSGYDGIDSAMISFRNEQYMKHVRRVCDKWRRREAADDGRHSDEYYQKMVLVDDVNKYLYCIVPKVSCTVWKKLYLQLHYNMTVTRGSGLIHGSSYTTSTLLRRYTPEEITHRLHTYTKFMFVRHPLERLLSVFNEKFQDHLNSAHSSYWFDMATRMFNISRDMIERDAVEPNLIRDSITFDQFVQYVIRESEAGHVTPNRHWRPQTELCQPCLVDYHFIGRHEHMWEDSNYVLRHLIQRPDVEYPRRSAASTTERRYWTRNTSDLLQEQLRRLDPATLDRLHRIYRKDYELFQYSPTAT